MATAKLSPQQIDSALAQIPEWIVQNEKLHRVFTFSDFGHALGFMVTAGVQVEKINHHPEWFNVYNRVTVDLTTHDAGGITDRDVTLAALLDRVATKFL